MRYQALRQHMADHSGAMPAPNARVGKLHIGEWVIEQCRTYAAGQLPLPLAEQFEALPGWTKRRSGSC